MVLKVEMHFSPQNQNNTFSHNSIDLMHSSVIHTGTLMDKNIFWPLTKEMRYTNRTILIQPHDHSNRFIGIIQYICIVTSRS